MKKLLFLFSFLLIVFTAPAQEDSSYMAWEAVSPQGQTVFFIGSVHMVKPDLYPLETTYYDLLDQADVMAFEVHLDSLLTDSQRLLPQYGLYPMGESLKDHLPEDLFEKLDQQMQSLGVPLAMMLQMKPWVVASSLTALELQQDGYSIEGIDQHLFSKAKEKNKPIIGLETTEFQMRLFADLSDQEQIDYLKYSLENARESVESIDEIMELLKKGDGENLDKLLEGGMNEFSEEVYKDLIVNRNKNWIPIIENLLSEGKTPLIIVGAGHLVGTESVIDLLKAEDFKIKQL